MSPRKFYQLGHCVVREIQDSSAAHAAMIAQESSPHLGYI